MFGIISRYKGIDEVVRWWSSTRPEGQLVIAGPVFDSGYGQELERKVSGVPGVTLKQGRLSDEELKLWLCAANCALFNYKQIFTSGAACLARSFGLPILLPSRLTTVDLGEPSPLVDRFEHLDELLERLQGMFLMKSNWAAASDWRLKTSWGSVAKATVDLDEPSPLVDRFEHLDELTERLQGMFSMKSNWAAASDWRLKTSWGSVAKATLDIYRRYYYGA
jgi:glycosyltransferase involved in cell wall biosynthesis